MPPGIYEIEEPKYYPLPKGGISGANRARKMKLRARQRKNDHKKWHFTKPTRNISTVPLRHLSLPPETKSKFPPVVLPRLKQIEYDKLEQMGFLK